VVRRLATTRDVAREGRRRRVAAAAVAARRVIAIERAVRARVARCGIRARDHAHELGTLVAGLAGADATRTTDRGVAGDGERRRSGARRADKEAARVDVGSRVATRAVAVERADRNVVARARDHGDVGERTDRRAMAREAARHALVRAGHRVGRVDAGGVALCAGG